MRTAVPLLMLCGLLPVLAACARAQEELKADSASASVNQARLLAGSSQQPPSNPSSPAASGRSYQFPADLVAPYTRYPMSPPYFAAYQDGRKGLLFLAATHGTGSFSAVNSVFKEPLPQLIIVEMDDGQIANHAFVDQYAVESEPHMTAKSARERGIPVWGGEPLPVDQLASFLKAEPKFTLKDYEGFYVVRTLLGGRRAEAGDITKIVDEFMQEYKRADPADRFTQREFEEWYRAKNGKEFSGPSLREDETWPDTELFTQKVANVVTRVRDVRIGGRIADALNQYDRVLVVYGAGHQVELGPALQNMLGRPELRK